MAIPKRIRTLFNLGLVALAMTAIGVGILLSLPIPQVTPPAVAPEIYTPATDDGWQLALYRYPPCWTGPCLEGGDALKGAPPVILCHGLSSSRFSMDLTEGRSLGRYLASRGFDVWLLDLRGHGASVRSPGAPPSTGEELTIDDYIQEDVPAAINYVKEISGAERVHWVGHSMGGMILYGHLAIEGGEDVASATAISSPGRLYKDTDALLGFMMDNLYLMDYFPTMPAAFGGELLSRVTGRPPMTGFSWELENMEEPIVQLYLAHGLSTIYPGELQGMRTVITEGGLVSLDGETRYLDHYKDITTPFLLMTGKVDKLGPPASLEGVYQAIGSDDKKLIIAGKEEGFSTDYGHGDILLGSKAPEEIYPLVFEWLKAHSQPPAPEAPLPEKTAPSPPAPSAP